MKAASVQGPVHASHYIVVVKDLRARSFEAFQIECWSGPQRRLRVGQHYNICRLLNNLFYQARFKMCGIKQGLDH